MLTYARRCAALESEVHNLARKAEDTARREAAAAAAPRTDENVELKVGELESLRKEIETLKTELETQRMRHRYADVC